MSETLAPHLFVYGTLLRGAAHPMYRVLHQGARLVGDAYMLGKLYQVHHYPGAVISSDAADKVWGELYELRHLEKVLAQLDDYEGCGPGSPQPTEFARSLLRVFRNGGMSVDAWVYLYNRPVGRSPRIASGRFLQSGRQTAT